jgi:hypothetical protein
MVKEVQMSNDQREIHRKKRIIECAERIGNVKKACRYFGVARSTFLAGAGLARAHRPQDHPALRQIAPDAYRKDSLPKHVLSSRLEALRQLHLI